MGGAPIVEGWSPSISSAVPSAITWNIMCWATSVHLSFPERTALPALPLKAAELNMSRSEIPMDPRFSWHSMLLLPARRSPFNRARDPSPIRFLLGQLLPSPGEDLHMLLMLEIPTPLPGATTAFTQDKKVR